MAATGHEPTIDHRTRIERIKASAPRARRAPPGQLRSSPGSMRSPQSGHPSIPKPNASWWPQPDILDFGNGWEAAGSGLSGIGRHAFRALFRVHLLHTTRRGTDRTHALR